MGKHRVCGKRCHNAKRSKCRCWCGGLFHGAAAEPARDAFRAAYDVDRVPTLERTFDELTRQAKLFDDDGGRWRQAIAAARQAEDLE